MNVPLFKVHMSEHIDINRTLQSGYISEGPIVQQFESELKKLVGNKNCLTVNSATAGLTLAVRLVADGGEVVTTPLTCFATTSAILANSCTIRWTDVDDTCGMFMDSLFDTITPDTKAIVVVHWGGVSVNMDKLFAIRDDAEKRYGTTIYVIQDCAHAFLSTYKDQVIGANPKRERSIGVYSFQAIKHLTTGDGGMIVVPPNVYDRAKRLRWFGIDRDGMTSRLEKDIPEYGYKFHMNDINATIGMANVEGLLSRRRHGQSIALIYDDNITCPKQAVPKDCDPNYWLYTLFMPNRDQYIRFMTTNGIQVSPVHKRNDINSCVREFKKHLPVLDTMEKTIVSIPVGWWVTKEDAHKIVTITNKFYSDHQGTLTKSVDDKVIVRRAMDDDAKEVIVLYNQERAVPLPLSEEDFHIYLETIFPMETLYVITEGGEIRGMAKLITEMKLGFKMARIEDVYIDKNHRGKEYGSRLVKYMINAAKHHGQVDRVVLGSPVPDFYTRLGFKDRGSYMVLKF